MKILKHVFTSHRIKADGNILRLKSGGAKQSAYKAKVYEMRFDSTMFVRRFLMHANLPLWPRFDTLHFKHITVSLRGSYLLMLHTSCSPLLPSTPHLLISTPMISTVGNDSRLVQWSYSPSVHSKYNNMKN